jgi:hypothetical protein
MSHLNAMFTTLLAVITNAYYYYNNIVQSVAIN